MKIILKRIIKILILALTFLSGLVTATIIWIIRNWAEMNASELIYHLTQSVNGANPEVVKHYLLKYFFVTVLIMIIAVIVAVYAHRRSKAIIVYSLYLLGSMGLVCFSGYLLETRMGLITYYKHQYKIAKGIEEDFIKENYVDPKSVEILFPEKKRNIIYIFLESFEMTYADASHGGAFERNVIPMMTELSFEGEDFSGDDEMLEGGESLTGTDWTMGGMFAESAGVPLQVSIGGNGMQDQEDFFPGLTALGDILEEEGYVQELMIGSDAKFGGRDKYYTQHGNYKLLDYNWAIKNNKIPEDYYVWWGYEDEKLFEFAKEELDRLSSGEKPFNLTLLTVDTHFEDGYICPQCRDEFGDDRYANVFACSDRQVYSFVKWIQEQPFYEDTTVIISGDHTTMDTDFCAKVSGEYQRRTYVNIINGNSERMMQNDRKYTTMDLFPTTLAAMGISIQGDRLGLGTNLYSDKKTLLELYGTDELDDLMGRPSSFMMNLSNVYITTEDLDKVSEGYYITETNEDGKITVSLSYIRSINVNSLEKAELVITRKSSGEKSLYDMSIIEDDVDPNIFTVSSETDFSETDLNDITVEIYFTVQGIENYRVLFWEKTD